jgi:hypothetical protein
VLLCIQSACGLFWSGRVRCGCKLLAYLPARRCGWFVSHWLCFPVCFVSYYCEIQGDFRAAGGLFLLAPNAPAGPFQEGSRWFAPRALRFCVEGVPVAPALSFAREQLWAAVTVQLLKIKICNRAACSHKDNVTLGWYMFSASA